MRTKAFFIITGSILLVIIVAIILLSCLFGKNINVNEIEGNSNNVDTADMVKRVDLEWNDDHDNTTITNSENLEKFIINGNGTSWKNLYIETNAKEIEINDVSLVNSHGGVGVNLQASNVIVSLNNVRIEMQSRSGCALKVSLNAELRISGKVELIGGDGLPCNDGGSAITADVLVITGVDILELYGGNAGQGTDGQEGQSGTSYDISLRTASWFEHGSDGRDGGDGVKGGNGIAAGQGGDALVCRSLSVRGDNLMVEAYGGDGAKSGSGARGGNGGNGEGAEKGHPMPMHDYIGGKGGDAGAGGDGANEIRPGYGIICESAAIDELAVVTAQMGTRGQAGNGAEPGTPGIGGETMTGTPQGGATAERGVDGEALEESLLVDYSIETLIGEINQEGEEMEL